MEPLSVAATLVAIAAFLYARRTARQLAQLTEMYWQLRYDLGEVRARLEPSLPAAPQLQQTFVPLSSIKKGGEAPPSGR